MSAYQPQQTTTADQTASAIDATARTVHYKCGDCDMDVPLKRGEPIRCRNCGHRVLYKQRTNRRTKSAARDKTMNKMRGGGGHARVERR
ncbi:metallothionein-i transcription activator [Alternaria burnsii]|uniref:Metallothionein-i transcription activator n=2 Tax=Alternaria sect. Alternaria TaxID=2499237 RepID=A0A8H7B7B0_9PLEO|nr:metallothionein-i transcription activator [Alternaria burnsii]KAF7676666.1 metallothionein-i transcription activator [Alternaria burnsii]